MFTKFLASPFNDIRFNGDYCRAMIMAILCHVYYKDVGTFGVIGIFMTCCAWAVLQGYIRYRDSHSASIEVANKSHIL